MRGEIKSMKEVLSENGTECIVSRRFIRASVGVGVVRNFGTNFNVPLIETVFRCLFRA